MLPACFYDEWLHRCVARRAIQQPGNLATLASAFSKPTTCSYSPVVGGWSFVALVVISRKAQVQLSVLIKGKVRRQFVRSSSLKLSLEAVHLTAHSLHTQAPLNDPTTGHRQLQPAVGLHLRNPSLMDYYSFNRPRRDGWLAELAMLVDW